MGLLLVLFLTASISITVTDAQHAVIPAARAAIYRESASFSLLGHTDARGNLNITVPEGGTFVIEVDADGFRRSSRTVVIQPGQIAHEDFSLEVAGIDSSVVVTSSDMPQTVDEVTKALTVVDSMEISDRGEYSLAGILSAVPGLLVHSTGGPGQPSTLRVRGLRPDSAAILIDGMRFRDAASAQGDASQFFPNLNFIAADRVEVLRGSGSSLYGTNAASGVVNIVTDQGGGQTHGNIQGEGGNLGFLRGRSQIGGGALHDRLKYTAGLIHLNVMRGVDGNDRARSTGGQAFLNFDLTPRTAVSARFFGSDDFMQLNLFPTAAGIPAANIPREGIVPAAALLNYIPGRDDPDYRRSSRFHSTAFKLQQILSASASFQASYQRVHTSRVYINGPAGPGFQPAVPDYSRYAGDIDTIDLRSTTRLSGWNLLTAGYEFEREHYEDAADNNLPASQRVRTETGIRQSASALYFQNQSGFLQKRLQVSVSGRAQFFSLDPPVFQARGIANGYGGTKLVSPAKAMTGDISLSYFTGVSGTKFRAHLGNAYRAPSLFERFGAGFFLDPSTDKLVFTPYGDPFLNPDRYNTVDGGMDQYFWRDRIRVSGTYFYSHVVTITAFDLGTVIKSSTDQFGRSFGYINGSGGMSRGVELSAKAQPAGSVTLAGSYTYTNAVTDRDITIPGFWRVLGVPRHAVTLVATQQVGRRVTLAMDLAGTSEMFGSFTAAERPRAYRYPGLFKMDVSGSWTLKENDRGAVKINARVENIFNRTSYDLGWRVPGAAFAAGLGFQF